MVNARTLVRGLYAITPDAADTDRLIRMLAQAIDGGTRLVQYRSKSLMASARTDQARAVLRLCRARNVPLIVNDSLDLACEIDADGLHLGGSDGDLAAARARLGPEKLLGASCYDTLSAALAAQASGADHVAFGAAFASSTKPGTRRATPELFAEARRCLSVPIVAIGGLTPDNAAPIVAAGADALAVISALFDAPDVASAARRFQPLF